VKMEADAMIDRHREIITSTANLARRSDISLRIGDRPD
jgi:hypothetical protein